MPFKYRESISKYSFQTGSMCMVVFLSVLIAVIVLLLNYFMNFELCFSHENRQRLSDYVNELQENNKLKGGLTLNELLTLRKTVYKTCTIQRIGSVLANVFSCLGIIIDFVLFLGVYFKKPAFLLMWLSFNIIVMSLFVVFGTVVLNYVRGKAGYVLITALLGIIILVVFCYIWTTVYSYYLVLKKNLGDDSDQLNDVLHISTVKHVSFNRKQSTEFRPNETQIRKNSNENRKQVHFSNSEKEIFNIDETDRSAAALCCDVDAEDCIVQCANGIDNSSQPLLSNQTCEVIIRPSELSKANWN